MLFLSKKFSSGKKWGLQYNRNCRFFLLWSRTTLQMFCLLIIQIPGNLHPEYTFISGKPQIELVNSIFLLSIGTSTNHATYFTKYYFSYHSWNVCSYDKNLNYTFVIIILIINISVWFMYYILCMSFRTSRTVLKGNILLWNSNNKDVVLHLPITFSVGW